MAQLRCRECGNPVSPTEVVCHCCGEFLLDEGATTEAATGPGPAAARPEPPTAVSPAPDLPAAAAERRCPRCRASVADARSLVCPQCLACLASGSVEPPAAAPTGRGAGGTTRLTLVFRTGTVEAVPGQSVLLGRDAELSPAAGTLSAYDNVSRRHATIGLGGDGGAWIRDENSTNGTFLDGRRLPPGDTADLADGVTVHLAADASARVRIIGGRPA